MMRYRLSFDYRDTLEKETIFVFKFVPVGFLNDSPFMYIPEDEIGKRVSYPGPSGGSLKLISLGKGKYRTLLRREGLDDTDNK